MFWDLGVLSSFWTWVIFRFRWHKSTASPGHRSLNPSMSRLDKPRVVTFMINTCRVKETKNQQRDMILYSILFDTFVKLSLFYIIQFWCLGTNFRFIFHRWQDPGSPQKESNNAFGENQIPEQFFSAETPGFFTTGVHPQQKNPVENQQPMFIQKGYIYRCWILLDQNKHLPSSISMFLLT